MVPCSLWQRTVTRGSAAAGDTRVNPGTPLELARRALRAAPEDPEVLAADAYVLEIRGEDIAVAILTASALLKFPGITDAADKKVPEDLARDLPVAMGNVFRLIEVLPTAESSHDTPKQ
jgi:hypothetical protein